MIFLFIVPITISFVDSLQAQITLSGNQIRGNKSNAELKSEPIILTQKAKIVKIEGNNDGFWISGQNGAIQSFYPDYKNKSFNPKAIGYVLKQGKYWVYPNLKRNQEVATVKITLSYLN